MRARALGRTGLTVSEIGFGTWGLGGDAYGPVDDALSTRCLRLALEKGVTFYDTSDLYGTGHAEEVLGAAFEGRRGEVVIATKGGMLPHSGFVMPQDFSLPHMKAAFAASLERLRTDYVDLYFLHSPTLADLDSHRDTLDWLDGLKREGRIRSCGVSARSPAEALECLERFPFDAIQANFNLIDQRAVECGLFATCRERGVGVIARTPLCFGYLTGTLTGAKSFEGRDHRANWPESQLQVWAAAPGLFSRFYGASTGLTAAQFALGFCLAEPAVSTVIPGMMTTAQVEENCAAGTMPPLPPDTVAECRQIYGRHSFYDKGAKSKQD